MTNIVILHLSDLHFGSDWDLTQAAKRESVLGGLIDVLAEVEPDWSPGCIAISGDIAWKGTDSDFRKAESWLEKLLDVTCLKFEDVLVCAGNHDIDRNQSRTYARPSSPAEADEILRVPVAEQYEHAFAQFSAFCSRNKIPKVEFGEYESYLVGSREHSGIRFVSVNSSWFCKDKHDKGGLWVGLEHLRYLDGQKQLPVVAGDPNSATTVCLMHHPKEWLSEHEQHAYEMRPNTFDFLAKRCHVLLTGHTHGELRSTDRIAQCAWHFTAGAAYANAAHFNSFRLIRVRPDGVDHRAFEFDPRGAASPWKEIEDGVTFLPFLIAPAPAVATAGPANISALRHGAIQDARATVEGKSRQIRPLGQLPKLVTLGVRSQATKQQLRYEDGRLDTPDKQFVTVPFAEVCQESRKTILLGDLGSGKSTIVASYVAELNEGCENSIALIAPCKSLRLSSDFRITELIDSVGSYFSEQVAPATEHLDLKSLLDSGVEVSLVFDGLDELPRSNVSHFVKQIGKLAGNWPNIQVIATGRPVELLGVSYDSWQVCEVCRLTEEDKHQILRNEFFANGAEPLEADSLASTCISTLGNYPALNDVTVTPLAIRLSASRLHTLDGATDATLGDLLFELAEERLALWQQRDGRPDRFDMLSARLPTSIEKLRLLGSLALEDQDNL